MAQLAKIGASAHTAAEVLAKPALRLLRASRVQIEVAKAATLAPLVIDERLTERQVGHDAGGGGSREADGEVRGEIQGGEGGG